MCYQLSIVQVLKPVMMVYSPCCAARVWAERAHAVRMLGHHVDREMSVPSNYLEEAR